MDLDEFRRLFQRSEVDIWAFIDTAIAVAAIDYGDEIKLHRDGIVERLYASPSPLCINCEDKVQANGGTESKIVIGKDSSPKDVSPSSQRSLGGEDEINDEINRNEDDEQATILGIRDYLEEPNQSDESLIEILKELAAMEITFHALKATDIGRHVNRLRKHPSVEIRSLVRQLVRRWKDLVDEWVCSGAYEEQDGCDSPTRQKSSKNEHNQVPDFANPPDVQNSNSASGRGSVHVGPKNTNSAMKRGSPSEQPPKQEKEIDVARLASATRRLHQNYQDAENAKKQRTIQVMDISDIPKPRNGFISKNKGNYGRH